VALQALAIDQVSLGPTGSGLHAH